MHIHTQVTRLSLALAVLLVPLLTLLASCETTEEPVPPSRIGVVSGDGQYSKFGTTLPEPLVVRVQNSDFSSASGVTVRFRAVEGEGAVSSGSRVTDNEGLASINYTLGSTPGPNRIRAELGNNNNKFVEFTATASMFFCPEEDPSFVRKYDSDGVIERDLFLFTRYSNLNRSVDETEPGIVRLVLEPAFEQRTVKMFAEGGGRIVVHDLAFSHNGDLFASWMDIDPELMKVRRDEDAYRFSALEARLGAEVTTGVAGVLVGCDALGPFVVGCHDTLVRFDEARYTGVSGDKASNDAVAVDTNPQNTYYEDIYFIDLSDNTLRRLPLDSLTATGPAQIVGNLTRDEAFGARGMVCNDDGTLFILVDDEDDTKVILRVTTAGDITEEYNFFNREPETPAGVLNDLAIREGGNPILYTVDTLGDMLLKYDTVNRVLSEFYPDTLAGQDPESLSLKAAFGERVGLVVLP
jgi:hypothetical protein